MQLFQLFEGFLCFY